MEAIKYKVVNASGQEVGTIDLDPEVFGAEVHEGVTFDAVRWQLDKKRAGTHSCLSKGEMKGGNKKPWRQKGTGRARAGSNTSPVWVGGAVAHGPKPHGYESRVSKRTRWQALTATLSDKVNLKNLIVLDEFKAESGKTKEAAKTLKKIGVDGSSMFVFPGTNSEMQKCSAYKAIKNIESVQPTSVEGLNVYDLLKQKYLVSTIDGVSALQNTIKNRRK